MRNRRFDHDLNNRGRHHGAFDVIFSLVSLALNIAFGIIGMILSIFSGILNNRRDHRMNAAPPDRSKVKEFHQQPPREEKRQEAKQNSESQGNINKEKVKDTVHQQKEETVSDWNILLFVLTLIPIIMTLAMKRLDLAGLSLLTGTVVIVFYNIIRNSVIAAKKRRAQKKNAAAEQKKEETEIEKTIKEAFDKVYKIRKDLVRIPKQDVKEKIERLCSMSEKIIGEVRANPDSLNSVRKFFYYYLDAFHEVFIKYLKLYNFEESSDEVQKLLRETEKSFDDMEGIFKDLFDNMLEKDMLNLKATINVIKNSN